MKPNEMFHGVCSRLGLVIRGFVALVLGGAIPLAALMAASSLMTVSAGSVGGIRLLAAVGAAGLAGTAVAGGTAALRRLEKGWLPFLRFIGGPLAVLVAAGVWSG